MSAIISKCFFKRWALSGKGQYGYNPMPKCASSTLKASLWKLEADKGDLSDYQVKQLNKNNPLQLKRRKLLRYLPGFLNTFTLVRNPYSRVLSAYLGKINKGFNRKINKNFSSRYQVDCRHLTFPQFVQIISGNQPDELNRHWMPVSLISGVRIHQYSYIGKLEAFDDFQQYLERTIGLRPEHLSVLNVNSTPTSELLSQYYDDQTMALVNKLYQDNFENFNYTKGDLVNLKGGEVDHNHLKSKMVFNIREELEMALSTNRAVSDVYSELMCKILDIRP